MNAIVQLSVGPAQIVAIVDELANNGRIASRRNDYRTRIRVRGAASWILLAMGVPLARVAEALGISGPGARAAARCVDAELARGGGRKTEIVVEAIGRMARSHLGFVMPSRGERLPPPDDAPRVVRAAPQRASCPTTRPCLRDGCRYNLGTGASASCAIDVADEGPQTRAAIGELLGLSTERVRQIEELALAKLAHTTTMLAHRGDLP